MQTPQGRTAAPASDDVTLIVFKENHPARTFNISLRWLSRLGFIAGTLIAIAAVSLVFALKFKFALRHMDPSHVQSLEQELTDLKTAYQALEAKKLTNTASAPTTQGASPSPSTAQTAASRPVATNLPTNDSTLRTILPAGALPPQDPATIPIKIESLKVQWSGKTLRTRFNIHYVATDQGTQQGSIIILARGPKTILAYPAEALGDVDSSSLLLAEKGEHFSVGRFREVKAEFGPIGSTDSLKTIEIFLFNSEGQLLIRQTAQPEARIERPAPTKTPAAAPISAEAAPAAPATTPSPNPETP